MKNKSKLPNIYLGIILLIIYIPIIVVIIYSFNQSKISSVWEGFSFHWYKELFLDRELMGALKNSLILAVISSVGAGFIGTLGAIGMPKVNFPGKSAIEYMATLPMMTPEIVMGILFLGFFTFLGIPLGMGTLVISHTAFCIPYVYMMVKARVVGMDESYEEAARDLGASQARVFKDITFPALLPAILSGMLLVFAMSMDDVIISIFINGAKSNTLPVKIYTQLKGPVSPKINALCTLMFLATIIIVALSSVIGNKNNTHKFSKEEI